MEERGILWGMFRVTFWGLPEAMLRGTPQGTLRYFEVITAIVFLIKLHSVWEFYSVFYINR